MTQCVFCSEIIPSEQLESHMIQFHSTFLPSHAMPNHFKSSSHQSFISKPNLSSTQNKAPNISLVGDVYDPDILRPLCFLDGKRIKENLKKHKREERNSRHHHKRPHKRRKLNDNVSCDTHTKNKKKTKHKRKNKKKDVVEANNECEIEEEGEEDAYGGLPYHFHLATHCEPKFDRNDDSNHKLITVESLLNPQNIIDAQCSDENRVKPTMSPCVFNPIHYEESDHLSYSLSHRDCEWIQQLIKSYDMMSNDEKKTLCVVHPNECNMDEETLNDIILADLEQYNFITNPLNEEINTVPPLVTVAESDSPEIVIQSATKLNSTKKKMNQNIGRKVSSLEAKKLKSMNDRNAMKASSHLTLPTLQTPKRKARKSNNLSNIPPLNQMMSSPSQQTQNMNNSTIMNMMHMNKNIPHNINKMNIGANSQNSTLLKIHSMINGQQQRKKQDLFHRFGARNHNTNRFGNNNNLINHSHNHKNHRGNAQILSIHDVINHNTANANASPTASNTTSNSTNSLNSNTNAPNAINMTQNVSNKNENMHNKQNNGTILPVMNSNDILAAIRKNMKKLSQQNMNQAPPPFQQQLNANYTLARYHQEVNGKNNTGNNNNLSLLNNVMNFSRK